MGAKKNPGARPGLKQSSCRTEEETVMPFA
jgi:hypothetical protein